MASKGKGVNFISYWSKLKFEITDILLHNGTISAMSAQVLNLSIVLHENQPIHNSQIY